MRAVWIVFRKELLDALRDRRTLFTVLLSSVAVGPFVLMLVSMLVGGLEKRAEERLVVAHDIEQAPTLVNFLARQTYTVRAAPADFEAQLRDNRLGDAVLVVAPGFERALQGGEAPLVEIVSASSNTRAEASAGALARLLRGFNQEQVTLRLAYRGVAPALLEAVRIEDRNVAGAATRAAQLSAMVPFFVLMAMLYGALHAALDTTAGERERGSLEPLLMTPASRLSLVVGKWGAVVAVAMLIAVLSCLSFLPGQWLLQSEALAAMFRFGVVEAVQFVLVLLPLAAALAAALMALAIRSRSFKEAQANAGVLLLLASLLPLMTMINQEGERPWHLWVPALGQTVVMGRVLKGQAIGGADWAIPALVSAALAGFALAFVASRLARVAVR